MSTPLLVELHPILSYAEQNQRTYVDFATVDKDRRKYTEIRL